MLSHFLRKIARPSGQTHRVARDGWVWHLTAAGRELFGDAGPDLSACAAAVVKQNLQRTVLRAELPTATVFVKRCRPNTPRAWVRELLRPAKARLEFENAVRLGERGVPTVEPLAWGARTGPWPGESVLVTRELAGEPLTDALNRPTTPAERRRLARDLARFVARLHDAGVGHPDPHPGNFLVTPAGGFALLDLHAVHLGRPLPLFVVLPNLVRFNRFFQVRAGRAERLRFWRAYNAARPPGAVFVTERDADRVAELIEQMTAASNRRFWTARIKRHLGDNRDTHRVRGPAANGWAARDLPPGLLAGWLADPDAAFRRPGAKLVKDSRTSTVAVLDTPAGPVAYKRFNLKSLLLPVKNLLRRPPAVRSWLAGHGLIDRDLPTARPLACFQRHTLGVPTVGYLVCALVPDASELPAAVRTLSPADRRGLAWGLGRLMRRMHDREVRHRDLKAANVLVAGGSPVLIDLVGVTCGRSVPRSDRVNDLARLAASFVGSPHVSNGDRLRTLAAYLGRRGAARGGWRGWWLDAAAAVRAKQAKNARGRRPLA